MFSQIVGTVIDKSSLLTSALVLLRSLYVPTLLCSAKNKPPTSQASHLPLNVELSNGLYDHGDCNGDTVI